ncbi:MAG: hypothetical protein PHT80_04610 [Lentisphaeria bacterium]|nr:hypothetical protein [Lentisphaeria bacterium]
MIYRSFLALAMLFAAGAVLAQDAAADLTELKITLPRPLFTGTPKELKTPNLEPSRNGEKRPPFMAPKGLVNLAEKKSVTSSDNEPVVGELECITDGDKEGIEGSYVELGPGTQWVQIDLEKKATIHAIVLWHFHSQARVYRDVVIQTADDPDFIMNVKTIFNNDHDNSSGLGVGKDYEYIETYEGRLIPVPAVSAQYLRFYSNGNTSDDMNHYIEIEVFGK